MFTGLIEEVGVVQRLEKREGGGRLSLQARAVLEGTKLGDSINVSGACLTVVELAAAGFTVDCMPETLTHTTLGQAVRGTLVNLERALQWGGRLGGHLVLGHVDAVVEVLSIRAAGTAQEVRFSLPEAMCAYVAAKGSIAIDGISLTIIAVDDTGFSVGIIPHTLKETTLRAIKPGQRVNIEVDVLARYVQRALLVGTGAEQAGVAAGPAGAWSAAETWGATGTRGLAGSGGPAGAGGGLTEELLREQGFI